MSSAKLQHLYKIQLAHAELSKDRKIAQTGYERDRKLPNLNSIQLTEGEIIERLKFFAESVFL